MTEIWMDMTSHCAKNARKTVSITSRKTNENSLTIPIRDLKLTRYQRCLFFLPEIGSWENIFSSTMMQISGELRERVERGHRVTEDRIRLQNVDGLTVLIHCYKISFRIRLGEIFIDFLMHHCLTMCFVIPKIQKWK